MNRKNNLFFENDFYNMLMMMFSYWGAPLFTTSMLATVTYPLAVRIARSKRLFKLRNFYAIHVSIAPFLGFIHLNAFIFVQTLIAVK